MVCFAFLFSNDWYLCLGKIASSSTFCVCTRTRRQLTLLGADNSFLHHVLNRRVSHFVDDLLPLRRTHQYQVALLANLQTAVSSRAVDRGSGVNSGTYKSLLHGHTELHTCHVHGQSHGKAVSVRVVVTTEGNRDTSSNHVARWRVGQLQDVLGSRQQHGEHRLWLVGSHSLKVLSSQHFTVRDRTCTKRSGHSTRLHGVHLITVEINLQPSLLASLQNTMRVVVLEDALLTEHVDEFRRDGTVLLGLHKSRNLLGHDILRSLLSSHTVRNRVATQVVRHDFHRVCVVTCRRGVQHTKHLELRIGLESVAALGFDKRRTRAQHTI
ncbi:hypothetical protein PPTG_22331 [Phytophthora nicotianae INRA-310]|uniref:Secreted protein n=1 Tax=Phytophthora nicotianae (strain INRA-310) TaxID=761204 RepID=W2QM63_PHYN3|nr:hypothetical protein PPTG_22331 [Phytophthora nicotianae INRA-310]ETN13310.1 hypothetical protein PPTG_22331 [Phytophthora nicotianae INRA-310]